MPVLVRTALPEDLEGLLQLPSAIRFQTDSFLVAVPDGAKAAGCIAAFIAWRRISPDECEILQLETLSPFRRRGLARRLVRELKKVASGDLFLEVRPSNQSARKLYESEGFTSVGLRRDYYSDPREDGIVLRFHPC